MRRILKIALSILLCVCLSTTSVLASSTSKSKASNKNTLRFNKCKEITIDVGSRTRLKVKKPKSDLRWSSNHPEVVLVNSGWLTPLRPGNAIVTATNADGEEARCKVVISCDDGLISHSQLTNQGAASCSKLMIVAHPDDETIFGGHRLSEGGWFVVCLTNGYNETRSEEFRSILSKTGNKGMILSYPDFQDNKMDNWDAVKKGLAADISRMVNYKKWNRIVTHNKNGEYGHIHHIITHSIVKNECKDKSAYDVLYYFGRFFWSGEIPSNEIRLSNAAIAQKNKLLTIYASQRGAIRRLNHIVPYENWSKAMPGEKIVSRKIKVKTKIKGAPAEGYRIKSVTLSHKAITVKGERNRIKKLSKKASIKLPAIKVTGKTKTFRVKVPVKKLLPKRTELGSKMPKKVTVTVSIEPIPTVPASVEPTTPDF